VNFYKTLLILEFSLKIMFFWKRFIFNFVFFNKNIDINFIISFANNKNLVKKQQTPFTQKKIGVCLF